MYRLSKAVRGTSIQVSKHAKVHQEQLKQVELTCILLLLVLKHNRVTEIATENDLPIIGLAQAASSLLYHKSDTQEDQD